MVGRADSGLSVKNYYFHELSSVAEPVRRTRSMESCRRRGTSIMGTFAD